MLPKFIVEDCNPLLPDGAADLARCMHGALRANCRQMIQMK